MAIIAREIQLAAACAALALALFAAWVEVCPGAGRIFWRPDARGAWRPRPLALARFALAPLWRGEFWRAPALWPLNFPALVGVAIVVACMLRQRGATGC